MAHLRGGNSKEDSILIDDEPTTDWSRAPRRPIRRSNPTIPSNVPIVDLVDDDVNDNSFEVVANRSPEAWAELRKGRDSRHQLPVVATRVERRTVSEQLGGTPSNTSHAPSVKPGVNTGGDGVDPSTLLHIPAGIGINDTRFASPSPTSSILLSASLPRRSRPVQLFGPPFQGIIKRDDPPSATAIVPAPQRFPLLAQFYNRDQHVSVPVGSEENHTTGATPTAQTASTPIASRVTSHNQNAAKPSPAPNSEQPAVSTETARETVPIPESGERAPAERQSAVAVNSVQYVVSLVGDVADRTVQRTIYNTANNITQGQRTGFETDVHANSVITSVPVKVRKSHSASLTKAPEKQMARKSVGVKSDRYSRTRVPSKAKYGPFEAEAFQEELAAESSQIERLPVFPKRDRTEGVNSNTRTENFETEGTNLPSGDHCTTETSSTISTYPKGNSLSHMDIEATAKRTSIQDARPFIVQDPMPAMNMAPTYVPADVENNEHNDKAVDVSNVAAHTLSKQTVLTADDLEGTRAAIRDCLKRHLKERYELQAYHTESLLWRQRTCRETEFRDQHSRRKRPSSPGLPDKYVQSTSPFMDMSSVQVPYDKSSINEYLRPISQETFARAKPKDAAITSTWAAAPTLYRCDAVTVPPFKEYVSLRTNLLADNESRLLATPYFQDENYESRKKLLDALPHQYEMKHDEQGPIDLRTEQVRFYKHSFDSFLKEVGISWNDILNWLLSTGTNIKRINKSIIGSQSFEKFMIDRSRYNIEEFERDEELKKTILFDRKSVRCLAFLAQLRPTYAKELRLSAIICEAVFNECNFNIWYLAQHSELVRDYVQSKVKGPQADPILTYRQAMCRVCHEHNCLFHGELREVPEDSSDSDSSDSSDSMPPEVEDIGIARTGRRLQPVIDNYNAGEEDDNSENTEIPAHLDDDSDVEKVVNYKLHMNPDAFVDSPEHISATIRGSKPPDGKFNHKWWMSNTPTRIWEKRKPFYPCNHDGKCEEARCRCYRENINCEKSCKCSRTCNRRFPGCNCTLVPGRRVCAPPTCLCLKFNRECDAELCGTCGATEVLDPINRYDEKKLRGRCSNVAIQRGVPKKTLLGESTVHGFGLYAGEDINQHDFIGEYKGEIISVKEGDRRSTIYGYQQTMYLFKLNTKQEVDATYMGNKLRFINNADKKYTNCYPQNLLCNMVFRIALYASTDIKAGTEFFFNYNYPKEMTENFRQPNQPKSTVVAVKKFSKSKTKDKPLSSPALKMSTSSNIGMERKAPSAAVLAAAATARAARAKKAAARLAEQSLHVSVGLDRSVPQRARKTALNEARKGHANRVSQLRGRKSAQGRYSQEKSDVSDTPPMETDDSDSHVSQNDARESQYGEVVVQDTDDEADDSDEGATRRQSARSSRRMPSMAPVIATKNKVKGGARSGAGRPTKRKRPVVLNSDDE